MKMTLAWVWYAVVAAAIVLMIATSILGHSGGFKAGCTERKLDGASMGWFKNVVCDTGFHLG